ncbi:MAG: hypothetical protein HUU37_09555, partial [Bdellovibrionales bacterium]|nr:hypothetical protein [Bdellovibrionales bacterium]
MKTRKFLALLLSVMAFSFLPGSPAWAADPVVPVDPGAAADDPSGAGGEDIGGTEDLPVAGGNPLDNADDLPPPSVGEESSSGGGTAPVSEPYLPAQGASPPQY